MSSLKLNIFIIKMTNMFLYRKAILPVNNAFNKFFIAEAWKESSICKNHDTAAPILVLRFHLVLGTKFSKPFEGMATLGEPTVTCTFEMQ